MKPFAYRSAARASVTGLSASLVLMVSAPPGAPADEFSWLPAAGGSWAAPANWIRTAGAGTQTYPVTTGDVARIRTNIGGASVVTLDGNVTVGALEIGDSAATFYAFTISPGSGGMLTFDNGPTNATLDIFGATE